MRKFKLFLNFEKEEKWLGHMAKSGWMLKGVTIWGRYCFEKGAPSESNYRMDFRRFSKYSDYNEYVQLFHDSGWLHVAGSRNTYNQYFRQTGAHSTSDIFSDAASRAGRYKRLSYMMLTWALIFTPYIFIALSQGTLSLDAFTNPKALWFTPGLWEMSGAEFWAKFLFEMPFAFARGFSWCLLLLIVLAYVAFTIKAWTLYRKTKTAAHEE